MVASGVRHPITLAGQTLQVSPLDDNGHDSLDEWVRSKYIERSTPMIERLKSESDKRLALQVAYRESSSLGWVSPFGAQMMGTVEGVAQLLYEGIRRNHPEHTPETIKALLLQDISAINRATVAFEHLNSPKDEGRPKNPRSPGTPRKPSRKKKST